MYGSIAEAASKHRKADVFINYASFRSAFDSSMEALQQTTIRWGGGRSECYKHFFVAC